MQRLSDKLYRPHSFTLAERTGLTLRGGLPYTEKRNAAKPSVMTVAGESVIDMKTIYLAGGCFWGTEHFFRQFPGVLETEVGYANGPTENPSYEEVCADSGHAETVRVVYDESVLSTEKLLDFYFLAIDPLSVNRQGHDEGIQYRTGIYYTEEDQIPAIEKKMQEVSESLGSPLAVETGPLRNFYKAEEYHQRYLEKNPGGYCHLNPELFRLAKAFQSGR